MSAGKPVLFSFDEDSARRLALSLLYPDGNIPKHIWTLTGKLMFQREGSEYHWKGCEVINVRTIGE